ncbi:MAG: hypothetical protein IPP81_21245 [Chitinophagaceae bacterium]|nr:hypothetical protein [Chitinophagaceae bacterium]
MTPIKLLLLLFILMRSVSYAHQDFWVTKTFGLVKVRIATGFNYEEINKAWIIGELTNKLAKNLEYKDTIFLDFRHYYLSDCIPDYFISYDDGSITEIQGSEFQKLSFLSNNSIVIREVSRKFDASITLQLTEYAIKNLALIKEKQKPYRYNKNVFRWLINSIDTSQIRKIADGNSSENVRRILANRIFRPKTKNQDIYDITYFFEKGKYHICYNDALTKNNVLLDLPSIYQLEIISLGEAVVFDTDSTFYYVRGIYGTHTSSKMTIKDKGDYNKPYDIVKLGLYKLSFSFDYYDQGAFKERTLIYRTDQDKLTQDLDKLLDK